MHELDSEGKGGSARAKEWGQELPEAHARVQEGCLGPISINYATQLYCSV